MVWLQPFRHRLAEQCADISAASNHAALCCCSEICCSAVLNGAFPSKDPSRGILESIVQPRLRICYTCYKSHYYDTRVDTFHQQVIRMILHVCFSFRRCWRLSVAVPLQCSRGCPLTSVSSCVVFLASIDPAWRQKHHNLFHMVKRPVLSSFDPLEMTKCSSVFI